MAVRRQTSILGIDASLRSTLSGIRRRISRKRPGSANALSQAAHGSGHGLSALPYDIILDILVLLDPLDVYHLSQISRIFYEVSQDVSIWRCCTKDFVHIPRLLVFDDINNAAALSMKELKRSLIRSDLLYRVWNKDVAHDSAKHRGTRLCVRQPSSPISGPLFSADRFIVMPYECELMEELCLIQGRDGGQHTPSLPFGEITFHPQYQTGAHFMTLNNWQSPFAGDLAFFAVSLSPLSLPSMLPERHVLLPIDTYSLPRGGELIEQIVDIANRRLYALYAPPTGGHLGVFVILDWKSGQCAAFKTGLRYRFGVATSFRLAPNGLDFDVCTDENDLWRLETYSVSQLADKMVSFEDVTRIDQEYLPPTKSLTHSFNSWSDPTMRGSLSPILYRQWTIAQPTQYADSTPSLFCHIRLYRPILEPRNVLKVVQYYSDASGPCCFVRSLFSMTDPVPQDGGPVENSPLLLCVAFTHMVWVEAVSNTTIMSLSRPKRVLKLATFPSAGAGIGEREEEKELQVARILDIPARILERICGVYIEPALASIYILTDGDNTLHRFQYA